MFFIARKRVFDTKRAAYTVLFLLTLCFLFSSAALAQAGRGVDLYNVKNVEIDETADNAVEARARALSRGQFEAFDILARQLLSEEARQRLERPSLFELQSMVQSFELENERTSRNRYTARMSVQFKPDTVQNYFAQVTKSVSVMKSQPVLVVPLFQQGMETILWDGSNPWRDAWNRLRSIAGLVPILVPVGDMQDMVELPDASVMAQQNNEGLQKALDRYNAGSALIVTLMPERTPIDDGDQFLRIFMLRFGAGFSNQSETIIIPPMPELSGTEFLDHAVAMTMQHLDEDWKRRTQTSANIERRIRVYFNFEHIRDWADVSRRLRNVPIIREVSIDRLVPERAEVTLTFNGDIDVLRMALAQENLRLSTADSSRARAGYHYQLLMR